MAKYLQTSLLGENFKSTRRPGTLNQGNSYEIKICALMALRLLNDSIPGIRNFTIAQNVDHPLIGDFDDVIITLNLHNEEEIIYCMQLKHFGENERKKTLKYETFHKEATKNNKSPFNLESYFKSVKTAYVENKISKIKYILFTNKSYDQDEYKFNKVNNSILDVFNLNGKMICFDEFKYPKKENNVVITKELDQRFLKDLVILCEQEHEENINEIIGKTLEKHFDLNLSQVEEITTKYIEHFTNWANRVCGGDRTIAMNEIIFKLGEFLLRPYEYNFSQRSTKLFDEGVDKWHNISQHYNVIIADNFEITKEICSDFESLVFQSLLLHLKCYTSINDWNLIFTEEDKQNFYQKHNDINAKTEMEYLWGEQIMKKLNLRRIYNFLWSKNKMPLVLLIESSKQLENVLKIIKFTARKFILFCKYCSFNATSANNTTLQSFMDLNQNDKELILSLNMKLQGRDVKLSEVLWHVDFQTKINTLHIAQILLNKFTVGKSNFTDLPEIFVHRTLYNILLKPDILKVFVIFIVICENEELFKKYIDTNNIPIDSYHKQVYSFFTEKITKNIEILKNYKIILMNFDRYQDIQDELNKKVSNEISFKILCLNENHNLSEFSATSQKLTVNLILNGEEIFHNFLKQNYIKYDLSEFFTIKETDKNYLIPFTCKYIFSNKIININEFTKTNKLSYNIIIYKLKKNFDQNYMLQLESNLGDCSEINKFMLLKTENDPYEVENCFSFKDISLISGPPGMGKSVLLNYLQNICPSNLWIVRINFNAHWQSFETNSSNQKIVFDQIKKFVEKDEFNEIDHLFFQKYAEMKQLCILFDGFDELLSNYEEFVCDFIKSLFNENYKIFLTSRPVRIQHLENIFKSKSRTIVPFSEKDQFSYITKYFKNGLQQSSDKIDEFVHKLISITKNSMSVWDYEFAGIPLQTVMLANIYLDHCNLYCKDEQSFFLENLDVLHLYEEFINLKIKYLAEKDKIESNISRYFDIAIKRSLDLHKYCAIETIFSLKYGNENSMKEFVYEIESGQEKLGLIEKFSDSGVPVFVHRTFAEYLVAVFISENYRDSFVQNLIHAILDNPVYNVVRNIMDRLFCRGYRLHRAILNRNVPEFLGLIQNCDEEELFKVDLAGRTILHLAMSWGARHILDLTELDDIGSENNYDVFTQKLQKLSISGRHADGTEYFVNIILEKSNKFLFIKDSMLQFCPFEYALKIFAVGCIDCYVKYFDTKFNKIDQLFGENYKQIIFLSCIYNYSNLLNAILKLKPKFSNMTFGNNKLTLLHISALYNSYNVIKLLSKYININVIELGTKRTPLHYATMFHNTTSVYFLLNNGAKAHVVDVLNFSPLYYASVYNYENLKEILRDAENKSKGKKTKITKLNLATISGNYKEAINLLNIEGVHVDEQSDGARLPLMSASDHGHTELVKLFLERGANVNAINDMKWTALMYAARKGYNDIITLLLSYGANVDEMKEHNDNAISLALLNKHPDAAKLIQDAMKK